jgi:hypothetical protein
MIGTALRRKNDVEVAAHDLFPTITEKPFCGPVEEENTVILVYRHEALVRALHRPEAQSPLLLFPLPAALTASHGANASFRWFYPCGTMGASGSTGSSCAIAS